jgi:hypothetical protein
MVIRWFYVFDGIEVDMVMEKRKEQNRRTREKNLNKGSKML